MWQNSRELVSQVYELLVEIFGKEQYGLISQIQRAVISIPSNIAEGSGRGSDKDFSRFLGIAISSSFELETELLIATDLNYLNQSKMDPVFEKIQEIQKMIYRFKESLSLK